MKILILTQYFWPETFAINGLVDALESKGATVTILTGQPNYPEGNIFPGYAAWRLRRERYGESTVLRVPLFPRGQGSAVRLVLNYLSFVVSAGLFAPWLLRKQRFDVVLVYAPSPILQALPAALLARLRKIPLALWVQDLWPESLSATGFVRNRRALAAVASIVRFIYRTCDAILIPSHAFREPIERLIGASERIHYYPNSVEQFSSEPSPQAVALADAFQQHFSVIFAGNLGIAQSLDTILAAADLLRERTNICFYFVGSGSRDGWLADEIDRRRLGNVNLVGRFPAGDMEILLSSASVLLVTLKDEEIFAYTTPSKLQAYLAVGRPIIAALNGEGARIVEEAGAGLTCAAEDAAGLAEAILQMEAMSESERSSLGAAGHRYYLQNFESRKLTEQLLNIFEKMKEKGEP